MDKKITQNRVEAIFKQVDVIYTDVVALMEESYWIMEEGPSQEIINRRAEIETVLSNAVVMLLGFSQACSIDLSAAIENRLKEITDIMDAREQKEKELKK